jgi:hypothetical protein
MKLPLCLAGAFLVVGCRASDGGLGSRELSIEGPLAHPWTQVDETLTGVIWLGDPERGALIAPMYRGASDGVEDYIFTPDDHDCQNARGVMRIDWDRRANTVHYQVKYKKVPVHPAVHRTEGVDFFENPLHGAPKDFENGGYRFWTVLSAQTSLKSFYYDFSLHFVGSEFDFPNGPPPGTIPVSIPVFTLWTTQLMFADPDGSLFHEYTVPYDHVTLEGGAYDLAYATYIPLDLCMSNPVQPTLGQLRPWVGPWLTGQTFTWKQVLDKGPIFDTTVDENQPFPQTHGFEPYIYSGIAFIGNQPVFQGGIPNGYRNDIDSVILQVAPAVRPLEGGNGPGCHSSIVDPHLTAPRFCEGGGQ